MSTRRSSSRSPIRLRYSPIEESALELIALSQPFSDIADVSRLLDRVKGSNDGWITTEPLYITTIRLLALASYDKHTLSGPMIALYAKRLIEAEVAVGGPYSVASDESQLLTNTAIEQLFLSLGSPLPNVHWYVRKHIFSPTFNIEQFSNPWIFFLPHNLVSSQTISTRAQARLSDLASRIITQSQSSLKLTTTIAETGEATPIDVELSQLPPLIQPLAKNAYSVITATDINHEICSLTRMFVDSLTKPTELTELEIQALDTVNVYIWIAYTHYDSFIDDEGEPALLPLANILHRKSHKLLLDFSQSSPNLVAVIGSYFDTMDSANMWELTYCRQKVTDSTITISKLPRYGQRKILAQRAGLHGLSPILALLRDSRYSQKQTQQIRRYFSHYLIARQLNDDLHDWKEDLANGHMSFVVTFLLRKSKTKPGSYSIRELTNILQTYFWRSGLTQLNEIILSHTQRALLAAKTAAVLKPDTLFITHTIQPIIDSVAASNDVVRRKKEFLANYKLDDRRRR